MCSPRILGPADQIAFNASVIRGAVESLSAGSMLSRELSGPVDASSIEWVLYDSSLPEAPAIPFPREWPVERVPASVCRVGAGMQPSGLSALMPGDFTVSLRSSFYALPGGGVTPPQLAAACGDDGALEGDRYRRSIEWLGIDYRVDGRVVAVPGGLLQLEVFAPLDKSAWLSGLWEAFGQRLGVAP